ALARRIGRSESQEPLARAQPNAQAAPHRRRRASSSESARYSPTCANAWPASASALDDAEGDPPGHRAIAGRVDRDQRRPIGARDERLMTDLAREGVPIAARGRLD